MYPLVDTECALMRNLAVRITQVRVIFKLPDHLGLYPHPLAYVEWFTLLHRRNPISGQYIITRLMRNHWCNVSVIGADRFARTCHLQAQCGRYISSDWSSGNVLDMVSSFHVNLYIDLDTFVHQQITWFCTALDRGTQKHRVPSLVHSGHHCPDEGELVAHCTAPHSSH